MVIRKETIIDKQRMIMKLRPINLKSVLTPKIEIYKNHIEAKVKRLYIFPLLPREYPTMLEYGYLRSLLSSYMNVDISLHLDRLKDETAIALIHKDLTNIKAELLTTGETSPKYSKLKLEYDSLSKLKDLISARKTHAYFLTLSIAVKGKTYKEAEETLGKVESALRAMNFKLIKGYYRVWAIFKSTLPMMDKDIPYYKGRFVHTDVITASFPFISEFAGVLGENMILYGINDINSTPVFVDRFYLPSQNMLVFGKTGSGKSYFEKLTILRAYNVNPDVMIYAIDPLSENAGTFKALGGININLWQGKHVINPLELRGEEIPNKVRSVIAMLETLFQMNGEEMALLDVVLNELYRENEAPIMDDLIERCAKEEKLKRVSMVLEIFKKGSLAFLNRETNFKMDKDIVNFDLGDVPDNLLAFFMTMVIDYIYSHVKRKEYERRKKLIYVDEVHHLWSHERAAEMLSWMARHTRHYKTGMTLLTQSANDAFLNKFTRSIMENTEMHLLLYHDYISEDVRKFYKFVPQEERYITIRQNPKELGYSVGLLRLGVVKVPIRIYASEEEDEFISG